MKTSRTLFLLLILMVMLSVSSCASLPKRNPLPDDFEGIAQIPGMPKKARTWGDERPSYVEEWHVKSREDLQAEFGGVMGREHNYLAISGGGQHGAFGAGLLVGWTAAGTRPEFTIVTGISTGALIAPFAFVGPAYDAQLKEIYTTYSTDDLIKKRHILTTITGDSAASTERLKALIIKYFNQQVIEAIAAELRKGRILFIGTTDLDTGRPVIWNITRIAASGNPRAPELIHKVLLASASIPVAFPPVIIEVEAKGQRYDEMHVDGGTSTEIFLYPAGVKWDMVAEKLEVKGTPNVFLIRNARLEFERKAMERKVFPIASRAISSLIRTQGIGDMYRLYLGARRDGLNYHLAYIPDDLSEKPKEMFDPKYMRKLFDLGYRMAKSGYPWHKAPPGFESP
ncbi:MAG: patatin-like phospholipase family protein [Planctomycetota bacterium]|jgi:predicted acylesterase/phospholipase RssA